jgi:hypothetical protein
LPEPVLLTLVGAHAEKDNTCQFSERGPQTEPAGWSGTMDACMVTVRQRMDVTLFIAERPRLRQRRLSVGTILSRKAGFNHSVAQSDLVRVSAKDHIKRRGPTVADLASTCFINTILPRHRKLSLHNCPFTCFFDTSNTRLGRPSGFGQECALPQANRCKEG